MTNSKIQIIPYQQNKQSFISLVLPFKIIDSISQVLVYGDDPDGYQRKPNKIHYSKIRKYASQYKDSFILPTSIILGASLKYIENQLENNDGIWFINIEENKRNFRVVDGQHRIYGLREAAKEDSSINDFLLPVIIILTDDNRRSVELEVFADINSKAKRINTDLAELAKYDYQIKEKRIKEEEIIQHIGIKTAFYLKEKNDDNVWQNAIKFDIHSEVTLGIIGISIFTQSIKAVIDKYVLTNSYKVKGEILEGFELIDYCKNGANEIGPFLYKIWNNVIKVKWGSAFKEDIVKNDEEQLVKIFYSKDFYIQKGLGVKSINPIIGDVVSQNGINDRSVDLIKEKIFTSKVKIEHWKNGGPFAGFNSESGFNKIKKMILNEISVPDNTTQKS